MSSGERKRGTGLYREEKKVEYQAEAKKNGDMLQEEEIDKKKRQAEGTW